MFALAPAAFPTGGHTALQHVSGLIANSVWEFNSCAAEIVGQFFEAQ